jgi:methylase of polypeptide subunit release factors
MKCKICSQKVSAKEYIRHLQVSHPSSYEEFSETILALNNLGTPLTEIAKELGVTQKIVNENINLLAESETEYQISKPINIKEWEPKDFKMEATTVWSFKDRGKWATHSGKYRGNWSPYIPRNLILRYSKEGDTVLDPFLGSGTTLVETKLLKRKGIGIDINPGAIKIACENLRFNKNIEFEPTIYNIDSRNISVLNDNSIDLICAHPPYANIIKYSENIPGDLSLLDIDDFLVEISSIAKELFRVLKRDKYCAILIGDTRRNKHMVPLGFYVMQKFLKVGFILKENIIKEQHNCQATGFWYKKSIDYNFLLIAHEYLFVFRKP